jgi:geranylgeranyl diphosphate synthase type II
VQFYLARQARRIEKKLHELLPPGKTYPQLIHRAMRYSVLNGGKRIRPILVLAGAEACRGANRDAWLVACAIEMIHSYSLIHDDLPCLDNDDFRRGRPSCHKKFGEAYGVLTGDALLTYAFQILGKVKHPEVGLRLVREISRAIGTAGMIGGQVADKLAENGEIDLPTLDYINVNKTGQLIRASCLAGAIAGRAVAREERALAQYGQYLGLAFQVVDDIMDQNGYMRFMSEGEARKRAYFLTERAKKAVAPLGRKSRMLAQLADFVLARKA